MKNALPGALNSGNTLLEAPRNRIVMSQANGFLALLSLAQGICYVKASYLTEVMKSDIQSNVQTV